MQLRAWLLTSVSLFACVDSPEQVAVLDSPVVADLHEDAPTKFIPKADGIPGEYVVVLKDTKARAAVSIDSLATRHNAIVDKRFGAAVRGFSARMSEHEARALAADPDVAIVEQNAIFRAPRVMDPPGAALAAPGATQTQATQGIDRIDQRNLPLDGNYTFATDATGVTVFVLDSGIRTTHIEFTGRLDGNLARTAIDDGRGVEDCNGHGTHVSGTVAGTILGVAKKAMIVPIRVLDCEGSGSTAGIIAGIDFVAQNHPPRSVANLSLGGGASDALDTAIRNLVASGVTTVVAAGNENQNACNVSPAREPAAITVGSTTVGDVRSSFSNFGTCVDIFAPGSQITSAWIDADNSINTIDGTSMAAPHVAGVAALFLAQNPNATPAQVTAALLASATQGKVSDLQGSPNRLLHSNVSNAPPAMGGSTITMPADGATVGSMFDVFVDAPNALSVDLAADGAFLVTDDEAPFAFTIQNAPAGTHTITVTATFAGGSTATDTITVTVGGGGIGQNPMPPAPPTTNDLGGDGGGCSTGRGAALAWGFVLLTLLLAMRRRS